MNYYFVAKGKNGAFVGQRTLQEITNQYRTGEIPGDYVVTESFGPSYAEILKLGVSWKTVAELVANPPIQNERFASNQTPSHPIEHKSRNHNFKLLQMRLSYQKRQSRRRP